jgi:RNA polymerase sigma-70 factor (ECF subfamily)
MRPPIQSLGATPPLEGVRGEAESNQNLQEGVNLRADHLTDASLLAELATDSPEAVVAFVRRFQTQVFRVALAVVGNRTLAEDVTQQTFERAWRRARTFDPARGTVKSWLTVIARNVAIDTIRVRTPAFIDPGDLVCLLGSDVDDPERQTIRAETHSQLWAAVRRLPPAQARAVVMAGMYEMTAQEVAMADDIPIGTAKSRIRTAKIKLRDDLYSRLA